jgi:hypothetical protein
LIKKYQENSQKSLRGYTMKINSSWLRFVYVLLIFGIFSSDLFAARQVWIRVGSYWKPVTDSGDEGECTVPWNTNGVYKYTGFTENTWSSKAWYVGTENWTDADGDLFTVKISGAGQWTCDETKVTIPIEDSEGITIRKYVRNRPPEISVDGFILQDPFPLDNEAIAPEKIPGTADILLESFVNTDMGLSLHQKAVAYSHKDFDDFIIVDWEFTNTGNVDADEEIELPNQTLTDVFFIRQTRASEHPKQWNTSYGEYKTDTLRIPTIAYPERQPGAEFDNFGDVVPETGNILYPIHSGEAFLHIDKTASDESDWWEGGWRVGGSEDADVPLFVKHPLQMSPSEWAQNYEFMEGGWLPYNGKAEMDPSLVWEGTHHSIRMDDEFFNYKYSSDLPGYFWTLMHMYGAGPWQLAPGESFRVVWADGVGSISRDKGWEVGKAWLAGNATFDGENNLPWRYDDDAFGTELAPTANDKAKDQWIMTGRDSLHQAMYNAQWVVNNDFNVPEPPPAPSITVSSKPDQVLVEWGNESESASDFAGYRVYRSVGTPDSTWNLVADVSGSGTYSYSDQTASRGLAYFYAVTAYDDGGSNVPGLSGSSEVAESGLYLNRTTKAAYLTRPAGTLEEIVVVPNPFNLNAEAIQFTGERDKIIFYNVPGECIIDIYSESGDHIKEIVHDDGSGDQAWGVLAEEWSTTSSSQTIVSGIYIARIEETSNGKRNGNAVIRKFVIVR